MAAARGAKTPPGKARVARKAVCELRRLATHRTPPRTTTTTMSSNVGLSTPRGSGTSGYVQRNMSFLRPRDQQAPVRDLEQLQKYRQRAPDAEILAHDRKRAVEVKCLELQDELEEASDLDEAAIEARVDALRQKLLADVDRTAKIDARGLKPHQVHELAAAKMGMLFPFRSCGGPAAADGACSRERAPAQRARDFEGLRGGQPLAATGGGEDAAAGAARERAERRRRRRRRRAQTVHVAAAETRAVLGFARAFPAFIWLCVLAVFLAP